MTIIAVGVGVGIPLVTLFYLIGWLVGYNSNEAYINWSSGWDSGWDRGWDNGFDSGYICGIENRRKDKKSLKQKAEEEI